MKSLIIVLLCISSPLLAQDVFKEHLYSPDLIFKYREKIELTEAQANEIKQTYNNSTMAYNSLKWDLDAKMLALEKLLSSAKVDTKAAAKELEELLELENEIKRKRLTTMVQIKNILTSGQQAMLDEHKSEFTEGYEIMSSVNQDPRVVVRVSGKVDNDQPLYIVDGKETRNVTDVNKINPNDIKSISVLKGESAIEQYGEKGKNGVVIITLK